MSRLTGVTLIVLAALTLAVPASAHSRERYVVRRLAALAVLEERALGGRHWQAWREIRRWGRHEHLVTHAVPCRGKWVEHGRLVRLQAAKDLRGKSSLRVRARRAVAFRQFGLCAGWWVPA